MGLKSGKDYKLIYYNINGQNKKYYNCKYDKNSRGWHCTSAYDDLESISINITSRGNTIDYNSEVQENGYGINNELEIFQILCKGKGDNNG